MQWCDAVKPFNPFKIGMEKQMQELRNAISPFQ